MIKSVGFFISNNPLNVILTTSGFVYFSIKTCIVITVVVMKLFGTAESVYFFIVSKHDLFVYPVMIH